MVEPIHTQDDYNLSAIRRLLLAAFTAEELRRFCLDRPLFRPVVASFGPGQGLDTMVDRVIEFNETRLLWPEFLDAVKEERPRQYARFEGDLVAPAGREPAASDRAAQAQELAALVGQPVVWVPPGPFLMGSDKARDPEADDGELPQHTVSLPGYWIGRYPVTVARFKAFVADSGYEPADAYSLKGRDDHPVVDVSWDDARAYCRWLAERSGLPVALPTEAQWEKAARGTDGRTYPWGDGWDPGKCNSSEGGKEGTTPVGAYSPAGDSPYGCADMAGNVFEWCQSLHRRYPYDPNDGRENLQDRGDRVLRGGAFDNSQWNVRCAFRLGRRPVNRGFYLGFRLVVAPVSSGL